ncbi:MAG TPA: hypothetical protein PKA53_09305 [Sphingobacterium sp.]|nr:hypothetical protein [Sphingobacterium sp.]
MFRTKSIYIITFGLAILFSGNGFSQEKAQIKKSFIEFEREYVEKVYIKAEDRLSTRPFDAASKVVILKCRDKLSKQTTWVSKDSLLRKWSYNPKAMYTLDTNSLLILSDILLNTVNVQDAYKYAERAYQAYIDDSGFAHGRVSDVPPLGDFVPSHLILFYNSQNAIMDYTAVCFNCQLTNHGTTVFRIDRLTLSRLKNLFSDLGENVLKAYY